MKKYTTLLKYGETMFLYHPFHTIVVGIVIFTLFCGDLHAMPHMNYPGTRANAMGMAYTAIADDASALWYNPAGLAIGGGANQTNFDIILERGDVIVDELDKERKSFLALKFTEENIAIAISRFVPYASGNTLYQATNAYGQDALTFKETQIFGVGLALAFPGKVRIGAVGEVVEIKTDSREYRGPSGSFGAHWIPVEYLPLGLKIQTGGTYRLKSNIRVEGLEMYDKPESWNMGLAIMKSVIPLRSYLVLSAQYERTDFTSNKIPLEIEMMSYGLEWQIAVDRFYIDRFAFRAGMYQQEPKGSDSNFEMSGKTFGAGIRIGRNLGVEYALEQRKWEDPDIQLEEKFALHSVAVTYTVQW